MISVEQLEAMCAEIADKRAELDELSKTRKMKDAELFDLEQKMMATLESLGKTDYKSNVGTVYLSSRTSVKTPKDLESKQALFNYLREKGIFEELVSVNSMTLNSFYKQEKEIAESNGHFGFVLPGVGEPTTEQTLAFRKAK